MPNTSTIEVMLRVHRVLVQKRNSFLDGAVLKKLEASRPFSVDQVVLEMPVVAGVNWGVQIRALQASNQSKQRAQTSGAAAEERE